MYCICNKLFITDAAHWQQMTFGKYWRIFQKFSMNYEGRKTYLWILIFPFVLPLFKSTVYGLHFDLSASEYVFRYCTSVDDVAFPPTRIYEVLALQTANNHRRNLFSIKCCSEWNVTLHLQIISTHNRCAYVSWFSSLHCCWVCCVRFVELARLNFTIAQLDVLCLFVLDSGSSDFALFHYLAQVETSQQIDHDFDYISWSEIHSHENTNTENEKQSCFGFF